MTDNLLKYLIVLFTFLIITIIYVIRRFIFKENNIKNILKTYDSILEKDNNYKINRKENLYVKSIDDLVKMSYELDKKIIYIKKDKKNIFLIEEELNNLIYEV